MGWNMFFSPKLPRLGCPWTFVTIDGLRKTGDAPGHKPRLLLLVVLRILVVVVVGGS